MNDDIVTKANVVEAFWGKLFSGKVYSIYDMNYDNISFISLDDDEFELLINHLNLRKGNKC